MVQLMLTLGESSERSFGNREDYYFGLGEKERAKSKLCTKSRCLHSCPDWAAYPAYPVSALLNSVRNAVRQAVRSIFNKIMAAYISPGFSRRSPREAARCKLPLCPPPGPQAVFFPMFFPLSSTLSFLSFVL